MARTQSPPMFGRIGRIQKNASAPGAYVNQGFGRTGQVGRTFLKLSIGKNEGTGFRVVAATLVFRKTHFSIGSFFLQKCVQPVQHKAPPGLQCVHNLSKCVQPVQT